MIIVAWLLACTSPSPPADHDRGGDPPETGAGTADTGPATGASTGETGGHTGDTAVEPTIDCSLLVPADAITWTVTSAIVTEEDFDFDGQGWLLTQRSSDLQGIDRNGVSHFVAAAVGLDATGIRSTAGGMIMVAQPWTDSVRMVDPASGGSVTLLSGLSSPNGLEAGDDGMMYVTENVSAGRIRMVDPMTGDFEVIASAAYANGIALSPDEQTLFIASSMGSFQGPTRVMSMSRDASGEWDEGTMEVIYTHPQYVGSLTIDACGNLYGLEYSEGKVIRIDTTTFAVEMLVDLPAVGSYSALHFSPGLGGWELESLFVTSRGELYEIPTGIPGSHVLTP